MTLAGLFAVQMERSPEAEAVDHPTLAALAARVEEVEEEMAGESEDLRISN